VDRLGKYFSFQGRTNRQQYWLTVLALAGIMIVAGVLVGAMSAMTELVWVILVPVLAAYFWVVLALGARRLHDRNKSVWWLLLFWGVPTFFSLFAALGAAGGGSRDAANFIAALGLPFSIWAFVELGCLKGTSGPNKFGDDPLGPAIASEEIPA
jgi:uncharacterized membrane protein YhaH (DUF805 family)